MYLGIWIPKWPSWKALPGLQHPRAVFLQPKCKWPECRLLGDMQLHWLTAHGRLQKEPSKRKHSLLSYSSSQCCCPDGFLDSRTHLSQYLCKRHHVFCIVAHPVTPACWNIPLFWQRQLDGLSMASRTRRFVTSFPFNVAVLTPREAVLIKAVNTCRL